MQIATFRMLETVRRLVLWSQEFECCIEGREKVCRVRERERESEEKVETSPAESVRCSWKNGYRNRVDRSVRCQVFVRI